MSIPRILIVEDDPATLELIATVLSSDAEIVPHGDSRAALQELENERFDGIFLDLNMPYIPGLELTRRIRSSRWNRATPIVLITAQEDSETMKQAFAAGVNYFLAKPLDRQRLLRMYRAVSGSMVRRQKQYVRVPLRVAIICQADQTSVRGWTEDVSSGGLAVRAPQCLPVGTRVRLSFSLPGDGSQVTVVGTVVNVSSELRMGVQFAEVPEKVQVKVEQYIEASPQAS